MVIEKTPFQSFRLDLSNVVDCASLISIGIDTRRAIAGELGMGEKKVEGIFEWAEFLGVIQSRPRTEPQELTLLGTMMTNSPGFADKGAALEVLYGMISLNHPLLNGIINTFMYDVSRRFEPTFHTDDFKSALLRIGQDFAVSSAFLLKRSGIYLDLLANPASFGKLGIVVNRESDKSFRVNPRRPDWRSAAYILYESWPENVSRVRTAEVINGHDGLGRLFFLTEPEVMALLARLEQERAVTLEIIADLNQIGLNPAMRAGDFLEMLVNDEP